MVRKEERQDDDGRGDETRAWFKDSDNSIPLLRLLMIIGQYLESRTMEVVVAVVMVVGPID